MKIDFDIKLVNFKNEVIREKVKDKDEDEKETFEDLTLGKVCVGALMSFNPESRISGEEKVKRYDLALRIYKGGIIDVTSEEIVLMKKRVGEGFAVIVVGQVLKMLEVLAE